jgi:hypothetical protein
VRSELERFGADFLRAHRHPCTSVVRRCWVHAEQGHRERVAALGLDENAFTFVSPNEPLFGLVDMVEHVTDVATECRLGQFPASLGLEQLLKRDHLRIHRVLLAQCTEAGLFEQARFRFDI